jgi:hypothetical protein
MTGIELIAAERKRQVEVEGYSATHDDQHTANQLAWAACYYAMPSVILVKLDAGVSCFEAWHGISDQHVFNMTKWDMAFAKKKQKTRIQQLTVAGALIAAEIDRLLAEKGGQHG